MLHDRESALGNLFSDAMREAVRGVDVAITNGGGLRAGLPSGPLTYGAVYEVMPFDNRLVAVDLRASELERVLREHLASGNHGIVSVSGLRVVARCHGDRLALELRRADGGAIADDAELRVVTSDYLATGGDRLFTPLALARSQIDPLDGELMRDAIAKSLARRRSLDPGDPALYDAAHPRLDLPSLRPVRCGQSHD